ncbi:uncharacterized protein LOC115681783 [Syzygium oleosum]|uniref:uncharacterized protein LOC115681783 n=1 Tax=Syzygium oleosum TaxID=219896 RepID=UPI0024B91C19|nr:uncharacterized protein LOC115681783 [Syzygium oleosum]
MASKVRRFFCTNDAASSAESHPITLLSGPPSCGKTSLLFQFAYNRALRSNSDDVPAVVFVCNRRRLEAKPPYLSQGIDPSCGVFRRIQMKYVEDDEAVKKYFAAFHLHESFPAAVIVDDFGELFDERNCREKYANPRGRDLAMVRTLSLCYNAIMHASKKSRCEILLADTHHGDSPRLLYIYKRWVSSIVTIKGDRCGSFLLNSSSKTQNGNSIRRETAKYSIALQYLFLEAIDDDSEQ